MKDRWDSAFTQSVVLIHDFFDGHSYLRLADDGFGYFTTGDTLSEGDVSNQPLPLHGAGMQITVLDIEAGTQTATIQLQRWADTRPVAGPGITFGGVDVGGGGWIFVNGKMKRIPPHSPLYPILEQIAEVEQSQVLGNRLARGLVQEQAYRAIAEAASAQAHRALSVRQPTQACCATSCSGPAQLNLPEPSELGARALDISATPAEPFRLRRRDPGRHEVTVGATHGHARERPGIPIRPSIRRRS